MSACLKLLLNAIVSTRCLVLHFYWLEFTVCLSADRRRSLYPLTRVWGQFHSPHQHCPHVFLSSRQPVRSAINCAGLGNGPNFAWKRTCEQFAQRFPQDKPTRIAICVDICCKQWEKKAPFKSCACRLSRACTSWHGAAVSSVTPSQPH